MNILSALVRMSSRLCVCHYLTLALLWLLPLTSGVAIGGSPRFSPSDLIDPLNPSSGLPPGNEDHAITDGGVDIDNRLAVLKKRLALQDLHDYTNALDEDDLELNPEPESQDIYKRLSPSGFFGSRGKKMDLSKAFFGARGKRNLYLASGKRIDPNTFFGARGKRAGFTEPMDREEALQYNIERYLGELLEQQGATTGEEGPNVLEEKAIMAGGDREGLVTDKEMLLKLIGYFLSHRSPTFHTDDEQSSYVKVKRQPPSGFHAIRGR